MNDDDRTLLLEDGEDPDDPRWVSAYAHLERALVVYSNHYHRVRSGPDEHGP